MCNLKCEMCNYLSQRGFASDRSCCSRQVVAAVACNCSQYRGNRDTVAELGHLFMRQLRATVAPI